MTTVRGRHRLWPALARAVALAGIPAAASAAGTPTRYSLANGCYTLTGPDGRAVAGADRVRMQATALGRYCVQPVSEADAAATRELNRTKLAPASDCRSGVSPSQLRAAVGQATVGKC